MARRIVDREKALLAGGQIRRDGALGTQQRAVQFRESGAHGIGADHGLVGQADIAFYPINRKQRREEGSHRYGKYGDAFGARRTPPSAVGGPPRATFGLTS